MSNYTSLVSNTATLTVISSTILVNGDSNFGGIMDPAIAYAEGRIYRDLDLPAVSIIDTSVSMSSGIRTISLSTAQGELLEINAFNYYTPVGATSSNATRVTLMPVGQAIVDTIFPSATSSNCGPPEYFARLSNSLCILGPTPDAAYGTEVTANIRPAQLSAANSSTWLTQNLPELMQAAVMVFVSGYMRDFGAQSDDPKMAQSWENQYQQLKATALVDSARQKFQSVAWSAEQPSNIAPRV
jgi:hypothetical protein